jgi:hypothetical protein
MPRTPTVEQGENNLKGFQDFHLNNGSRKGENLALTVLHVPSLLDSGNPEP